MGRIFVFMKQEINSKFWFWNGIMILIINTPQALEYKFLYRIWPGFGLLIAEGGSKPHWYCHYLTKILSLQNIDIIKHWITSSPRQRGGIRRVLTVKTERWCTQRSLSSHERQQFIRSFGVNYKVDTYFDIFLA